MVSTTDSSKRMPRQIFGTNERKIPCTAEVTKSPPVTDRHRPLLQAEATRGKMSEEAPVPVSAGIGTAGAACKLRVQKSCAHAESAAISTKRTCSAHSQVEAILLSALPLLTQLGLQRGDSQGPFGGRYLPCHRLPVGEGEGDCASWRRVIGRHLWIGSPGTGDAGRQQHFAALQRLVLYLLVQAPLQNHSDGRAHARNTRQYSHACQC